MWLGWLGVSWAGLDYDILGWVTLGWLIRSEHEDIKHRRTMMTICPTETFPDVVRVRETSSSPIHKDLRMYIKTPSRLIPVPSTPHPPTPSLSALTIRQLSPLYLTPVSTTYILNPRPLSTLLLYIFLYQFLVCTTFFFALTQKQ